MARVGASLSVVRLRGRRRIDMDIAVVSNALRGLLADEPLDRPAPPRDHRELKWQGTGVSGPLYKHLKPDSDPYPVRTTCGAFSTN
jgi:hypothetical protein